MLGKHCFTLNRQNMIAQFRHVREAFGEMQVAMLIEYLPDVLC